MVDLRGSVWRVQGDVVEAAVDQLNMRHVIAPFEQKKERAGLPLSVRRLPRQVGEMSSVVQWRSGPLLQQVADGLIVLIETEDGLAEAADLVDIRFSDCWQPLTKVSDRYLLLVDVAVVIHARIAPGTFHVRPF